MDAPSYKYTHSRCTAPPHPLSLLCMPLSHHPTAASAHSISAAAASPYPVQAVRELVMRPLSLTGLPWTVPQSWTQSGGDTS
jgi:hypothetical protein